MFQRIRRTVRVLWNTPIIRGGQNRELSVNHRKAVVAYRKPAHVGDATSEPPVLWTADWADGFRSRWAGWRFAWSAWAAALLVGVLLAMGALASAEGSQPSQDAGHGRSVFHRVVTAVGCSSFSSGSESRAFTSIVGQPKVPETQDDEAARLEQFLESRGLVRLLIAHVERQLGRTPVGADRDRLIEKLARLYEQQLFHASAERDSESERWGAERAASLLRLNPHLKLEGLELAILSARFRELETAVRAWWYAGNEPSQRSGLSHSMREVFDGIDDLRRRDLETVRQLRAQLPLGDEESDRNAELVDLERRVLMSQFLSGWASVWIAVLEPGSKVWAEEAVNHFRSFLELPENVPIEQLQAKWFDFRTDWHVRAWVGLAYAHALLGDMPTHAHIFEQLSRAQRSVEVALWKIDSHALARQWGTILEFVPVAISAAPTRRSRLPIWMAVARVAVAADRTDMAPRLAQQAMRGLLRDFQTPSVQQLMTGTWRREWLDQATLTWATSLLTLQRDSIEPSELETTLDELSRLHNEIASEWSEEDLARIDYLIGVARFRLGRWERAQRSLDDAARVLATADEEIAESAAWLRLRALVSLAARDPRILGQAWSALDEFPVRFPTSRRGEALAGLRVRLLVNSLPPRLAVARLEELREKNPDDRSIARELAEQAFRYWRSVRKSDPQQAAQAAQLFEDVTTKLLVDHSVSDKTRARYWLRLAQMRLAQRVPIERWREELERLQALESVVQSDRALRDEFRFVRLQIAIQQQDEDTATRLARELLATSRLSADVLPALLWLADELRQRAELSSEDLELALDVNRRILEYYRSESPEAASPNAAVAKWELVKLLDQVNRRDEATRLLVELIDAFPDRKPYLVTYARWLVDDQRWEEALGYWRRLAVASQPGSELWLEAKWNVVRCLAQNDPDRAGAVIDQTMLLCPDMPDEWRSRFMQEKRKCESQSESNSATDDDESFR